MAWAFSIIAFLVGWRLDRRAYEKFQREKRDNYQRLEQAGVIPPGTYEPPPDWNGH